MSLVLTALIPGQARLLSRAAQADVKTLAFDYAQSHLAQIGITMPVSVGTRVFSYRDWTVQEDIKQTQQMDSGQILTITVTILTKGGRQIVTANSAVFIRNDP